MNTILEKLKELQSIAWGIVVVAFFIGLWIGLPADSEDFHKHNTVTEEVEAWTCSMHPSVNLPEPGQCPICFMDLIPLKSSSSGVSANQLSLSHEAEKLANIETSLVERGLAEMKIRLSGKVEYDETNIGNITAWVPGRLERMFVDYTGIKVKKGEHMVELYSPDLYSAQEELIQARNLVGDNGNKSSLIQRTATTTLEATREKLKLMGLVDEQIKEIETKEKPTNIVTVFSPMTGVVIEKNGVEGAYVKKGTNIYTIANLDRVWVVLDAYESDIPWLAFGQNVSFNTESIPGEEYSGKIAFIDPMLDTNTRTVKVRINVLNPNGKLKPGMFVHGNIHAVIDADGLAINPELAEKWICPMHPEVIKDNFGQCDVCGMDLVKSESMGIVHTAGHQHESLLIPASAVLKTGERAIVYVKLSGHEPVFEAREVVLGPRVGDKYMIKSGLAEGEAVVVRGNFKIDSAMQISAKPSMMNPNGGAMKVGHNHGNEMPKGQTLTMKSNQKFESTDKLQKAVKLISDAYFEAQSALAKDDFKRAKTALFTLNIVLSATLEKEFDLSQDANKKWQNIQNNISQNTVHAQHWAGIEEARNAFNLLSQTMVELEQSFGHKDNVVFYEIFCPMAFDNKGATWLSKEKDVYNPYFGAKMLKCGEVKNEYKPKIMKAKN